MIEIVKEKTCTVSGHRYLGKDFDRDLAKITLEYLIKDGIDTFLVGMAVGFDSECFKILLELKEEFPIKIVACIPCLTQSERFSESQKKEYMNLLRFADDKIVISENYTPYCMMKRNMYMIDRSATVFCYLREEKGGTFNTVKYAKEKNLKIIKI